MDQFSHQMHTYGISMIIGIQEFFKNQSSLFIGISHAGDPRLAFSLYFPLAYLLRPATGVHLLWVAAISEWLNAIGKWLLMGERPYWWVVSSGAYSAPLPHIEQFYITCETGPGSPSGHAMVTSAVWWVMVHHILKSRQITSHTLHFIAWGLYSCAVTLVCVSRLVIAAHFPHQVVAGALVGICLAKASESVATASLPVRKYVVAAIASSVTAAIAYCLVLAVGVDPLWSVSLALQHCASQAWVHLDTSLFYALVRDVSTILGLGLGLHFLNGEWPDVDGPKKIMLIPLGLGLPRLGSLVPMPASGLAFYAAAAAQTILVTFGITLLPKLLLL